MRNLLLQKFSSVSSVMSLNNQISHFWVTELLKSFLLGKNKISQQQRHVKNIS